MNKPMLCYNRKSIEHQSYLFNVLNHFPLEKEGKKVIHQRGNNHNILLFKFKAFTIMLEKYFYKQKALYLALYRQVFPNNFL